jgi:zinc protease
MITGFRAGSLLISFLWVALPALSGGTEPEVQTLRSAGGIEFTYVQLPSAKTVSIAAAWQSNWVDRGLPSAAPYVGTELMLSGGAGDRDAATLSADYQSINGHARLFVDGGHVKAYLSVDAGDLDEAAKITADVLAAPSLDANWFARIKSTQTANILQNSVLQAQQAQQLIRNLAFDNALGRSLAPQPQDFDSLDTDVIKDWHRATFNQANLQVSAAGPLPPEVMISAIGILFDRLPTGHNVGAAVAGAARPLKQFIIMHTPSTSKSFVSIAGRLPPLGRKPEIEGFFGTLALGDGQSSRLNQAIRTELRATYGISAGISNLTAQSRLLLIEGEIEGSKLKQAFPLLQASYENLRLHGLTAGEFAAIQKRIVAYLEAVQAQPDYVARAMLQAELSGLPVTQGLHLLADVRSITLQDVNRGIAASFPPFAETVKVVASPDDHAVLADCTVTLPDQYKRCVGD